MHGRRFKAATLLAVAVGLVGLSGASCPSLWPRQDPLAQLPPLLPPTPSLEQVVQVVNANNSQIRSFSAHSATLSVTGYPTLQATVNFERPRRLRLRGQMFATGLEIDLGSNDELFWFWLRRNEPPATYFCRHDQFAASPVRRNIPIDPYWLIEAFGIGTFDPALPHQGPFPLPGGQLEVRTIREGPDGTITKVTVIDGKYGLILQQRVYDSRNQLVATSTTGRYRRDPASGLFMPTVVQIQTPATASAPAFSLELQLGNVLINQPTAGMEQLWAMPYYEGSPPADLCRPGPRVAAGGH
jgi:hypothetical protein